MALAFQTLLLVYLAATLTWKAVGQKIILTPNDRIVRLGDRVVFECKAEDSVTVTWQLNGSPVHPDDNHKLTGSLSGNVVTGKLTIVSMTKADEGTYVCTAASINGVQDPSRPFELEIAKPPAIETPASPFYGNESSTAILVCYAPVGAPPPRLTWLRNGVEQTTKDATKSLTLTIPNVRRNAAGAYECKATNMAGSDSKIFQLIINYKPTISLSSGASIMFPVKESRVISCNTTGLPKPRVWWTYGGKEVAKSISYPGSATLTLSGLSMEDRGVYTCNAENFMGKTTSTVNVELQGPPGSPNSPSLLSATTKSLHLRFTTPFTGNSPITAYKLQYSKSADDNWTLVHVRASQASDYELTHLVPNTAYITRAQAINAYGRSSYSSSSNSYKTLPLLPRPARSVKATATATTIRVTWRAPNLDPDMGSLIGYKIKYHEAGSARNVELKDADADETAYTISGLSRGTLYMVGVYAYSAAGEAPGTDMIAVNTTMSVPSEITFAQAFSSSPTSIDVTWSPPADDGGSPLLGYYVLIRLNSEWKTVNPDGRRLSGLTYHLTGLSPGKKYRFRLIATNRIGNSTVTSTEGTTKPGAKPPTPTDFQYSQVTSRTVMLTWTVPLIGLSDITSYRVSYRVKGSEADWVPYSAALEPKAASLRVLGLEPETEYEFRLIAYNQELEGNPTTTITVRTTGLNDPQQIKMSKPTLIETFSTRADVAWTAVEPSLTDATAYMILYRQRGTTQWNQVKVADLSSSTYQLSNLQRNTTYEVAMRLEYGEDTYGPLSSSFVFTTNNYKTLERDDKTLFIIIGCICGVAVVTCLVIVCLCCQVRPGSRKRDADVTSVPGEWCPGNYTSTANGEDPRQRPASLLDAPIDRFAPPMPSFLPPALPDLTQPPLQIAVASPVPLHNPIRVPSAIVTPYTQARAKTPSDHLPPYEPTEDTLRRQQNAPVVDPLPPTPSVQSMHSTHRGGEERPHLPSASSTTTDLVKPDLESQKSHILSSEALDVIHDLPPPPPPVTDDDSTTRRPSLGSLPENANDEENDGDREMSPPPPPSTSTPQPARPSSNQSNGSMKNLPGHRAASPIGALPPPSSSHVPVDMQSIGASSGRPMSTVSGNRPRHHRRRRNRSHSPGHHRSHRRRHQLLNGSVPGGAGMGLAMKTLSPAASQQSSVGSWRPPPTSGTVEIAVDLPPPDMPAPITEHTIV